MTEKNTTIIPVRDFDAYPNGELVKFIKGVESKAVPVSWVKETGLEAKGLIEKTNTKQSNGGVK
ncbi:MAG: hypothetical protein JKX85_02530 [Phycisphaeraceae bacterium]|nr:hypothetical protein [Phycisphaeraceae bacterium]